ncbi:MAG: hypothetical protein NTW00_00605 [Hyphomicrobiales bacterium]|jgi:hypothetical protein|nr:hypothetical protein [Hyphomicrobiales bacterium]
MLLESQAAVIARNETWSGNVETEPHEAGWAREAIFFVRALHEAIGKPGTARVELSPDGMRWVPEGTVFDLPRKPDEVTFARVKHFGTWLRVTAELPEGASLVVLVTLHLKG